MKKQWIISIAVIALALLIAGGMRSLSPDAARKPKSTATAKVETLIVKKQPVSFSIKSQGTVTPKKRIPLSSEVTGLVIDVNEGFRNGAFVKKDDVIIKIDPTIYELAVANAKAEKLNAQVELEDKQSRYEKGTLGIKQSQARYEAAETALKKAQSDLAKTTIKAPFDGLITNKSVDTGQYITTGTSIATLSDSKNAEVRLPLTEQDILLITSDIFQKKIQSIIEIHFTLGKETFIRKAQSSRLEGKVDDQTRGFYLVADIPAPYNSPALPLGSFVKAEIPAIPAEQAIRLPANTIHHGNKVYLAEEGKLKQKVVNILFQQDNEVIITDGLEEGDELILTRLDIMFEGMDIEVVK